MDRFSIIQRQVFNQPVAEEQNSCGGDLCVCDDYILNEKQQLKKVGLLQMSIITIVAFVIAFVMQWNLKDENVYATKGMVIISCGSKTNDPDDQLPGNKNNKNSCSHQQGVLYETNNSKRKILKIHNC